MTNSGRLPDLLVEGQGVPGHVGSSRLGILTFDSSLLLMMILHLDSFVVRLGQGLDCPSQCIVCSGQTLVCSSQALVRSDQSCYSILLVTVETKAIILLTVLPPADASAVKVEASPRADPLACPSSLLELSSRSSSLTSSEVESILPATGGLA